MIKWALPNSPLKRKIWLSSVLIMVLVASLLSFVVTQLLFRTYDHMEQHWIAETQSRLEHALGTRLKAAISNAKDYANWNDTAEVIQHVKGDYAEANLNEQTFSNIGISAFLLFNTEGNLVLGRLHEPDQLTEAPVNASADYWTPAFRPLLPLLSSEKEPLVGYLRYKGELFIYAAAAVTNNEGSGPVHGYLWQLRPFNADFLRELEGLTGLQLQLSRSRADADEERYAINQPIQDHEGRTLEFLTARGPRTLHHYAHLSSTVANLLMFGVILCAEVCLLVLIHRFVLNRVVRMHEQLEAIKTARDLTMRLDQGRDQDELERLAASFNRLLAHLDESQRTQRLAEQEKEQLNTRLQQAQKMEAIGTMSGGIAHDFNNLLSSILCSAGMVRLELPDSSPVEEHVQRIETAGRHAAALIRQMLSFSRALPAKFEPLHLGDATTEVLSLLQSSLPGNLRIHFNNSALSDLVLADQAQLQQVIINLVTNASHALAGRKQGEIRIRISEIRLPASAFPETAELHGSFIHLEVEDNGCGMSEAVKQRIFDPYFTTKPQGTGTGLGLAVVHGIISKHGGCLHVSSREGVGTCFHVFVPILRQEPVKSDKTAPPHRTPLHILLVDDDTLVRDSLGKGLSHMGHQVLSESTPEGALKRLEDLQIPLDLLITDHLMPRMTGLELGERARIQRPNLRLLMLTGFAASLDQNELLQKGFSGLVMKPVTMEQLAQIVSAIQEGNPLPSVKPDLGTGD